MKLTIKELQAMIADSVGKAVADRWEESRETALEDQGRKHTTRKGPAIYSRQFPKGRLSDKPVEEMTSEEKGLMAARCIRYLYASGGNNPEQAIDLAKRHNDKSLAETWEKALGQDTLSGGGALLPPEFAAGVIELLTPATLVRRLGATTMPMNTGSLTMPFINAGSTASYVGENQNIGKTEPTFGQLQLSDKKLAALVPTSNDLLNNAGGRADQIIRDDLVRALSLKEDITFIRSDGTQNEPKGMRFWSQEVFGAVIAGANPTVQEVIRDLGEMIRRLEDNDVPLDGAAWMINPTVRKGLFTALDSNSNPVFRAELDSGRLMGFPFGVTTQIPSNLGGPGDESEVYFAAFPLLVIAENETMRIEMFPGGAYFDGAAVVSGISQDQTVMRAIAKHDFGARQRGQEVAVLTGADWDIIVP